jgi:Carboxypeptidase regulatory-like domain
LRFRERQNDFTRKQEWISKENKNGQKFQEAQKKSMKCNHFQNVFIVATLMALLWSIPSWGQLAASLDGVVQDPSGAVIVGVRVDLTNASTGVVTSGITNSSGRYVFPFVLPGSYSVAVTHSGFKKWNGSAVLHANEHVAVNVILTIGNVTEDVNVSATSEGIQNDSGQRSETLTSEQIGALSTEGNNAEELLPLLPGVVENGSAAYGNSFNANVVTAGNGGGVDGFNINGNRADANTFQLDGGNMNDVTGNNGSNIYPNTDFISEMTIETSNFTADQGGSPVLITASTKSGTKDLHGEGFWTGRNYLFNANDWSNNYAGTPRPQSKFNYPGFDVGGPILLPWTKYNRGDQKKLFFFVGIQWDRQLPDYGTQLGDVPSSQMLTGNFSSIVNSGTCSAARATGTASSTTYLNQPCQITDPATGKTLDTQGGQLSSYTPSGAGMLKSLMSTGFQGPNYTDPNGQWNYAAHPLYPENLTQYVGRFDWNPSDKARMYVRLGKQNESLYYPYGEYAPEINSTWTSSVPDPTPGISEYNSRSLNFSMVSILSPKLTNEFTFNGNALDVPNTYKDPTLLSDANLGVSFTGLYNNGYSEVPQIVPQSFGECDSLNEGGCGGGEGPNEGRWGASNLVGLGNYYKETQFEFKDNLTKVMGAHILKFGALFGRARNNQNMDNEPLEGYFVPSNWASGSSGDEYSDILTEHFAEYVQASNDVLLHMRSYSAEWFGQDSWKVRKNLTLEYGIRWTWQGPWYDVNGLGTTFDPTAYNPADSTSPYDGVRTSSCKNPGQSAVPLCGTLAETIRPNGHPLTQPRIGFSWDTRSNGETVVRGGFGAYTQRDPTNASFGAMQGPPNLKVTTLEQYESYACCTLADVEAQAGATTTQGGFTYGDSSGVYSKTDDKQPDVYQYNLTVDQRLPRHFLAEFAYVGSQSRHLQIEQNIDAIPYGALWETGTHLINGSNPAVVAPYAPFTQIEQLQHSGNADYNALQTTLRRQATHNLNFIASYTYSKAMGQSDEFEAPVPDPFSTKDSRHVLTFDRTHVFSIGYQYLIPGLPSGIGLGKSIIARGVVNGWMLSGITTASSGGPVAIDTEVTCLQTAANGSTSSCATSSNPLWDPSETWFGTTAWSLAYLPGTQTTSPEGIYPAFTCNPRQKGHGNIDTPFINTSCVALPAFGQQGDVEPPYIKSPGSLNFNLAMQKSFRMGENRHLDVRVSSFDLTNRAQPVGINAVADFNWTLPYGATDPSQGTPTLTNGIGNCQSSSYPLGYSCEKTGSRQMEGSVKFFF